MTYSSALFKKKKDGLYDAQINKYHNLANLINVKPNDRILEIGCGWGGFSEFLAKKYKSHVTAITISKKQYECVKEKIFINQLNELVDVKFKR